MMHKKYILWPALALLAIVMACTNDDIVTLGITPVTTHDNVYTYKLQLNMAYPGSTTRGEVNHNPKWPDGSTIEFNFTISDDNIAPATATYSDTEELWTVNTGSLVLPVTTEGRPCYLRFLKLDDKNETKVFRTPTYTGTSKYLVTEAAANDQSGSLTIDTLTLHPATWRLRFKGTKDEKLNFSSNDIVDDLGNKLTTTLPLTVDDGGYTPYIYAKFANADSENTITVETGGKTYHKTINGAEMKLGGSRVLIIPTENNYEDEKWEKEQLPVTNTLTLSSDDLTTGTNGEKVLLLDADGTSGKKVTVNTNTSWQATVPEGLKCDPQKGTNTITVTISANETNSNIEPIDYGYIEFSTIDSANAISEKLHVIQEGAKPFIELNTEQINLRADGYWYNSGNYTPNTLHVTSNTTWTISIKDDEYYDWLMNYDCIKDGDSNYGKREVDLKVWAKDNTYSKERKVKIQFSAEGVETKTVLVIQAAPYTEVTEPTSKELIFNADDNHDTEETITVNSNEHWSSVVDYNNTNDINWCYATGWGPNTSFKVWVNENENSEMRTATVLIKVKRNGSNDYNYTIDKVTIKQKGKAVIEPKFEVDSTPLNFEATSASKQIVKVNSNVEWSCKVTQGATWCYVEEKSNDGFYVKVDDNDTFTSREAKITVSVSDSNSGIIPVEITVTQKGGTIEREDYGEDKQL